MQGEQALTLRVFKKSEFRPAAVVLALCAVLEALLSPEPILLLLLALVVLIAVYISSTLGFFKVYDVNLISVMFPEGKVRLNCHDEGIIDGVLGSGQWCTRHMAVLRIVSKRGGVQNLVVLSRQQRSADEFRRLHVWLRQGAENRTRQDQVLVG